MSAYPRQADTICEACGENPAEEGGWYCAKCETAMEHDAEGGANTPSMYVYCSSCTFGEATIWGLCDDCYDDAHNTRTAQTSAYRQPYDWWNHETPERAVPPFATEATHHRGVPPYARESTHHRRRVTSNA